MAEGKVKEDFHVLKRIRGREILPTRRGGSRNQGRRNVRPEQVKVEELKEEGIDEFG